METSTINNWISRSNVTGKFKTALLKLYNVKINIIVDNSESMTIQDVYRNNNCLSRWDETKLILEGLITLGVALNPNKGVNVYFINGESNNDKCVAFDNVRNMLCMKKILDMGPHGNTPLCSATRRIEYENLTQTTINIYLIDGNPYSQTVLNENSNNFLEIIKNQPENIYSSFVAITGNSQNISFLESLDDVDRCDTCFLYNDEKRQVQKYNKDISFTYGDYYAKIVAGSIDKSLDKIDERQEVYRTVRIDTLIIQSPKLFNQSLTQQPKCCVIM
jgi:hypothetical protein